MAQHGMGVPAAQSMMVSMMQGATMRGVNGTPANQPGEAVEAGLEVSYQTNTGHGVRRWMTRLQQFIPTPASVVGLSGRVRGSFGFQSSYETPRTPEARSRSRFASPNRSIQDARTSMTPSQEDRQRAQGGEQVSLFSPQDAVRLQQSYRQAPLLFGPRSGGESSANSSEVQGEVLRILAIYAREKQGELNALQSRVEELERERERDGERGATRRPSASRSAGWTGSSNLRAAQRG